MVTVQSDRLMNFSRGVDVCLVLSVCEYAKQSRAEQRDKILQ